MNEKLRTRTSKFLSLVLRHEPQRNGLDLDPSGWVGVDALLTACRHHGMPMEKADLEEVVATVATPSPTKVADHFRQRPAIRVSLERLFVLDDPVVRHGFHWRYCDFQFGG